MNPPPPSAPISVVIPVYQCAQRLPGHIDMIRHLRPAFGQVIWVCTPSQDRSHDTARREAESQKDVYLEVPPGLYHAWNEGIARATRPYTYVSTVGDTITPEGLASMLATLQSLQAAIVFSPPKIQPATRENIRCTRHWPIFHYDYLLRIYDGRIVPTPVLARFQLLAGISCLLGSFASCLCETSLLQARPFPLNFHHYGDTAWFYQHLTEARVAYLKNACTTFHVHDHSVRYIDPDDLGRCIVSFAQSYAKEYPSNELLAAAFTLRQARSRLNYYRQPHPYRFWWLNPMAWFWRFLRTWTMRIVYAELLFQITLGFLSNLFQPSPKEKAN